MKSRFQNRDKRSAIHSVKSQRQSETGGGKYQRNGDKYIQKTIKSKTNTSSAGKVNKLLQGQWPKNSIFYLNKLRNLETHNDILPHFFNSPFEFLISLVKGEPRVREGEGFSFLKSSFGKGGGESASQRIFKIPPPPRWRGVPLSLQGIFYIFFFFFSFF